MDFYRYEDESSDDLIKRVCQQKKDIGKWDDVAKILNDLLDLDYGESKYRKQYAKMNKDSDNKEEVTKQNKEEKSIPIANTLTEAQIIDKERKKLQTEKLEYNKWLREEARDEMIKDEIISAINKLSPLPQFNEEQYLETSNDGHKELLLCFGDAHYGIEFEIYDFFGNIINSYSPNIFQQRMNKLFWKIVDIVRTEHVTKINIWELGDGVQGILRLNSQLMKLKFGIIESSIMYADYIANWLNGLSEYVQIEFQMVIDSNHNQLRLCSAPKNAFSEENMSKVMYTLIKERLKNNKRVTIICNPTGMNFMKVVGDYNVLGIHGEVKNLNNAIGEFSKAYGKNIDYLIGAHIHTSSSNEVGMNCEVYSIRSIVGVDPYAMSLRKVSNAGASCFVFDQDGMSKEYKIKLN